MQSWDTLESRMLLSVTVNAAGWTQVTPSANSRIVYVSSSQGSNSNSGLSPLSPVQTIAKGESLLRGGMPDALLLKSGDTFNDNFGVWTWSGASAQEPMVIGSYGTGARPIVATGIATGLNTGSQAVSNVDIIGISFYANQRDPANGAVITSAPTGIRWVASGSNLLIEDCSFNFFATNVIIEAVANSSFNNVTFARNEVTNAYCTTGHSQGLFTNGVNGIDIEDNIFDHNGWNAAVPGANATIFNHNVYIQVNCTGLIFTSNISARASATGLQARIGGQITDNLFIDDPIGLSYGLVNGGDAMVAGGVSGTVSGNVFIGSANIAGAARGYAMEIDDIAADSNTAVSSNIIIGDSQSLSPAIHLDTGSPGSGVPNPSVGVNDLTISSNIIYHWQEGIWLNPLMTMGATGPDSINGLVVENNQIVAPLDGLSINQGSAYLASAETWQNNHYVASKNPAKAFAMSGSTTSITNWVQNFEPTASTQATVFPDSTRTIASYDAYLGGPNNLAAFLVHADNLSSLNWNPNFTAAGPINYIRAGFGVTPTAGISLQAAASAPPANNSPAQSSSIQNPQITLNRQPLANVQLNLNLAKPSSGQTTTFSLSFTPDNWNVPQSIPATTLGWINNRPYTTSGTSVSVDRAFNGTISTANSNLLLILTGR